VIEALAALWFGTERSIGAARADGALAARSGKDIVLAKGIADAEDQGRTPQAVLLRISISDSRR